MNPRAGGAEIHMHEIFRRLAARGHEVTALVSGWTGASQQAELDGLHVHRVGSRHTFNVVAPGYFRRHLRSHNYDVLVEDLNKVPIFAPFWAGIPVTLLVHHLFGTTAFREASLPVAAATWLLERPLPLAYRRIPVVAVSRSTRDDLIARGFSAQRIQVIENGVDTEHFSLVPGRPRFDAPTVLYLGRLKRYKRIDLIVQAFARLSGELPAARLIIAGSGDYEPALRRQIDALGLAGRSELAGRVSEAEKLRLLRGAWVHVLTSPKEGWGITNLEAAACGTPTVASNSPGLRDSVRDGLTGFLVPHGDLDALAGRLRDILLDPALRDSLGLGGRQFAEQFTWDRAADRMEHFLAGVAHGRGRTTEKA